MAAILPLVKKYDAAVIALPNDHDEIPMEADKRLDLTAKIVRVATQEYGIAQADIVIDPLAMPIGADTSTSLVTLECMRRIRDEFGVNMTCGASNVSFGMPDRHTLGAAWLPMAMTAGLTSAIMDTRTPQIVEAVKAADVLPRPRRVGHGLDRGPPGQAGRQRHEPQTSATRPSRRSRSSPSTPCAGRGCSPRPAPSRSPTTAPGGSSCPSPSRTRRRRRRSARSGCRPASPSSTRRPGTASRSTPPAAATAPATSARSASPRSTAGHPARRAHLQHRPSCEDGWRLACLVQATRDLDGRRTPAHHPAQGRDRRRRPAGDPAARRPEAVRRAHRADARGPAAPTSTGCCDAIDDLEPQPDLHVLRRLPDRAPRRPTSR